MYSCLTTFLLFLLAAFLIQGTEGRSVIVETIKEDIPPPPFAINGIDTGETPSLTEVLTKSAAHDHKAKQALEGFVVTGLDLYLSPEQNEYYFGKKSNRQRRKATLNPTQVWTDATMPYAISPNGDYTTAERQMIFDSMKEISKFSCVKFRGVLPSDRNSVVFINDQGCYSLLGSVKPQQPLSLQKGGCRVGFIVLHEILHALGFNHEHQRPDRDDHVRIVYQNVQRSYYSQFDKARPESVDTRIPYDLKSIMHYDQKAFSGNGQITIQTRDSTKQYLLEGRNMELTFADKKALNVLYKCDNLCQKNVECPESGYVDQFCTCHQSPTSPEPPKETCNDNNRFTQQCPIWATYGYCSKFYKAWMLVNCKKSCGVC